MPSFRTSLKEWFGRLFGRAIPQPGVPAQPPGPPAAPAYPPLIFLDSNNLHFGRLFIDFAESQGLPPFSQGDLATADAALGVAFTGLTLKSYLKGRKIVDYLRRRCNADAAQVEYSPITTLEVTCGLLKGNAILDAAGQGVTNRMWGKIDETEILERLQPGVYAQIQQHTTDVEGQFQKAGIALRETDPERLREAWSLSRSLLGLVYLEVGDALVYASALLAEADELRSSDDYLRKVVNRIHNAAGLDEPERTQFLAIADTVKDVVSRIIGVDRAQITLPNAPERFQ